MANCDASSATAVTAPDLSDRVAETIESIQEKQYPTFDALYSDVSEKAELAGFAVAKRRASNRDPATGEYLRRDIECVYSRENEHMSTGRRQGKTSKCNCEWKAKAIFSKQLGHWVFTVLKSNHNHFFSALPANIPANRRRRRTESIVEDIERQRKQPNINSSDIVKNNEGLLISRKDVLNIIQKIKLAEFGLRTPTQQFLRELRSKPGAILEMLWRQRHNYNQKRKEEGRTHINREVAVIKKLHLRVSHYGLKKIVGQVKLAEEGLKKGGPITPCTKNFGQQYGLPCWHTIYERLENGRFLEINDIHPHYWLRRHELEDEEVYREFEELDPRTLPSRKRSNKNNAQPLGDWASSTRTTAPGESTSTRRDPSHDEPPRQKRRRVTATQQATEQAARLEQFQRNLARQQEDFVRQQNSQLAQMQEALFQQLRQQSQQQYVAPSPSPWYYGNGQMLPPASQMLPPASQMLPPASQMLPPTSQMLPPESQMLPPASQMQMQVQLPVSQCIQGTANNASFHPAQQRWPWPTPEGGAP
ncbi:hypothetical protein V8E54_002695 [Elaphomyces granulatus]